MDNGVVRIWQFRLPRQLLHLAGIRAVQPPRVVSVKRRIAEVAVVKCQVVAFHVMFQSFGSWEDLLILLPPTSDLRT